MTKKMLAVGLLAVATMPSCMHPVDQVLHARAESKARLLEAQGQITDGACDDVGQYAAQSGRGLTLGFTTTAQASAQPVR